MNKTVYYFPYEFLSEKQVYQNTGTVSTPAYTLLSTDVYCYNGNQTNCQTATTNYPITQRDIYHTDGSMTVSSRVSETFDSYGNRTYIARYGYGASSYTTATTITYSGCGQGATINGRQCTVVTTDGTHTLSQARFTYNSAGFMLTSSVWNGSTWITESYSPNSNGTVAAETDPNGTVTTYAYAAIGSGGCNGLLRTSASVTPVTGDTLTASQSWDCNGAVVTGTTDPNGNTTSTTYDPMMRIATFTDEAGLGTTSLYTGNSITDSYSFGSVSFSKIDTTDGYARSIRSQAIDGNEYDTASIGYYMANPYPYTMGSTPTLEPLGTGSPLNSYKYMDALGRPHTTIDADAGQSVFAYSGGTNSAGVPAFDTQVTVGPAPSGEHVKVLQSEYDGLGRVVSTCGILTSGGTSCGQVDGGSGVLTTVTYSFGQGTSSVSSTRSSQTHTMVSDALGRPTAVTTPESGTVSYTYDADSGDNCGLSARSIPTDLAKTTRNDGSYVCYIYNDGQHRLTDVMNSTDNPSNPCKRYRYDNSQGVLNAFPPGISPGNALGHLVEAETDTCGSPITSASIITDEWFGYDKNGRLTDVWELTPHSGGYYHTTVSYYLNGVVNVLSGLPSPYSSYTVLLNSNGVAIESENGAQPYLSSWTWNAAGQPTQINFPSGYADTYTYDPTGLMETYTFNGGSQNDGGILTWNGDGTLQQLAISDSFYSPGTQTCTFSYDDIVRLITDNCGSTLWNQAYSYDQYDNLTKTGNPGTSWIPGYNPSNNQIIGASYDLNGNVTYDLTNTYTWDVYGNMSSARGGISAASCGTSGTCVTYDADGRAVEKNVAGKYTEILYSPLGKLATMSGSSLVEAWLPAPGDVTIDVGPNSKKVNHFDWLGTVRLQTPLISGASPNFDTAYSPYGEEYDTYGVAEQIFTGDHQNLFSGLFDTPSREFDQLGGGRWLSPDPAGASWNAYAYPTDPNTGTDPTGLFEAAGGCSDGSSCPTETQDDSDRRVPEPPVKCLLCPPDGDKPGPTQNLPPNDPGPAKDSLATGWDLNFSSSFTAQVGHVRAAINNTVQNAEKGLDWYNKWLGFAPTDCSTGGNCSNALGMAGTSIYVTLLSFGESEEANGAKLLKQLKEAPATVTFLRNELLAQAKDPALRDAIDNLFRANAKLGDGSSMAALREEIQTGVERRHWQKLIDRRTQLLRVYRSGRLGASDRAITRFVLLQIQDALSTRPPI